MAFDLRGLTPLLQVYDMPASVRFYRDGLGFAVVATSPILGEDRFRWGLLRLGNAELMLNTAHEFDHRPAKRDPVRTNAHDDTGLFFGCANADAGFAELRSKVLR